MPPKSTDLNFKVDEFFVHSDQVALGAFDPCEHLSTDDQD